MSDIASEYAAVPDAVPDAPVAPPAPIDAIPVDANIPAADPTVAYDYAKVGKALDAKRDENIRAITAIQTTRSLAPQEAADAIDLAKRTGLDPELVKRNLPAVQKEMIQHEYSWVASSPAVQKFLADPINAQVAASPGDYEKLGLLEQLGVELKRAALGAVSGFGFIGRRMGDAAIGDLDAAIALKQSGEYLTPYYKKLIANEAQIRAEQGERIKRNWAQYTKYRDEAATLPELEAMKEFNEAGDKGDTDAAMAAFLKAPWAITKRSLIGGLASMPVSLAAAVVGTVAGGPGTGAIAAGLTSGGMEYAGAIIDVMKDLKIDVADPEAVQRAFSDPAIMKQIEQRGTLKALAIGLVDAASFGLASIPIKLLGWGARPAVRTATGMGTQMVMQGAAGAGGDALGNAVAGLPFNVASAFQEFVGEFAGAPLEVAAARGNLNDVKTAFVRDRIKEIFALPPVERDAATTVFVVERMIEIANTTKLSALAPDKLIEFMQRAGEEEQTVFVPASVVETYMQDMTGIESRAFLERLGITEQQIERARVSKEDIAIPLPNYVMNAGEAHKAWRDDIRTEVEGFSVNQAKDYEKTRTAETQAILQRFEEGIAAGVQLEPRQIVQDKVFAQLKEMGLPTRQAASNAALLAGHANAMATLEPTKYADALDFYEKHPIRFESENTRRVRELAPDRLDILLDSIRSGKDPLSPPVPDAHVKARADAAALELTSVLGPGPEKTPAQIAKENRKAAQELFKADRENLAGMLAEMGVDPKGMSNDEIRSALERAASGQGRTFDQRDKDIKGNPEGEAEDAKWRSLKPGVTSTGKIKGAPSWVENSRDLTKLRNLLKQFVEEGRPGRFWYENSARTIMRIVRGDILEARKLIGLVALYSPQTPVFTNMNFAIAAYEQYARGEEIDVKTGFQNRAALAWLRDGTDWGGRKTNSFYQNLTDDILANATPEQLAQFPKEEIEESEKRRATVDLWVLRAMGYDVDAAGSAGKRIKDDDSSSTKYGFSENEIKRLAGNLNKGLADGEPRWTPHQVQAALWTAIKARFEIPKVKADTMAESKERGYLVERVNEKTGKTEWGPPAQGAPTRSAHMGVWRKHALKASVEDVKKQVEIAKGAFSDAVDRVAQNITWEAIPSTGISAEINDASDAVKRAFTRDAVALIVDEEGTDLLSKKLGVSLNYFELGTGAYAGSLNPNVISTLIPEKPAGSFDATSADLYARAIQFIFKQDAVPLFRADARADLKGGYAAISPDGRKRYFDTQREAAAYAADRDAAALVEREKKAARAKKTGEPIVEEVAPGKWRVEGNEYALGLKLTYAQPLDNAAETAILAALQKVLGADAGYTRMDDRSVVVINYRGDGGIPFMDDEAFAAGIRAYIEGEGKNHGIKETGTFGSEGRYGPVHDWAADPDASGLSDAFSGRPDLQSWLRGRQQAFDALLADYSGEGLAIREQEIGRAEREGRLDQQGVTLNQEARGSITFDNTGALVRTFAGRDPSTVLHELWHYFHNNLEFMARAPDASAEVKAMYQATLDYAGVKGENLSLTPAEWDRYRSLGDKIKKSGKKSLDGGETAEWTVLLGRVEQNEVVARAGEAFLLTGKSPSEALASAFRAFKNWLITVYRSVKRLNVPVSAEFDTVMAQMIATREEIEAAQNRQGLNPVLGDAKNMMSEAERDAYTKRAEQVLEEADDKVRAKVMAPLRRAAKSLVDDVTSRIKGEVTAEAMKDPGNAALYLLRNGKLFGSDDDAKSLPIKLSRPALVAIVGEDGLKNLPSGIHADDGMDLTTVAQMVGLGNGQELVERLMQVQTDQKRYQDDGGKGRYVDDQIHRETHRRVLEEIGDPLNDGSLEKEVEDAIRSDKQGALMAFELKILARKAGHSGVVSLEDITAWADGAIAEMSQYQAVQFAKYQRAERTAGIKVQQALLKGDIVKAFKAKQDQLVNFALYKAAKKAAEDTDKITGYLDKLAGARTIKALDQDYLDTIHEMLEEYDFKRRSGTLLAERTRFNAYKAEQLERGVVVQEPPRLKGAERKHFSQMSMEELRDFYDTIKQIDRLGRKKKELFLDGKKRELEATLTEMEAAAAAGVQRGSSLSTRGLSDLEKAVGKPKHWLRVMNAELLKVERLLEFADGDKTGRGIFTRMIYRPIADAAAATNDRRIELGKKQKAIYEKVPEAQRHSWAELHVLPELGGIKLDKEAIIAIALNMGNASNLEKMLLGEKWTEDGVRAAVNKHLTQEEWTFVQDMWDLIDSQWPEAAAMIRDVEGVEPPKIEAVPLQTPYGTLKGGYYPVEYARNESLKGDKVGEMQDSALLVGMAPSPRYGRPSSKAGSTNARTEFNAPFNLSLSVIGKHLDEITHDIFHRRAVADIFKIVSNDRFREAIRSRLGAEYEKVFLPWLKRVANEARQNNSDLRGWDNAMKTLRVNVTMMAMGLRVSTMVQQVAGYANSLQRLGSKDMLAGMAEFWPNPGRAAEQVYALSGEMRHRANNLERDVKANLDKFRGKSTWKASLGRFAFRGIALGDLSVSIPTWLGAYRKGLADGFVDADAIAYADKMVRDTQGSGGSKDLSSFQNGSETWKIMGMFYSFLNVFYNAQQGIVEDARKPNKSFSDYADIAWQVSMLMIVSPIMAALLSGQGPDDEEDNLYWAMRQAGFGAFSGIPIVRDLMGALSREMGGKPSAGFKMSPVAGPLEGSIHLVKDLTKVVSGDEVSKNFVKNTFNVVGGFAGLPTGQIGVTSQFLWDSLISGAENPNNLLDWMRGLTFGPERKK